MNTIRKVIVRGGKPLKGTVSLIPNKNSMLPVIAASVLLSAEATYSNVPDTSDISHLCEMLTLMGADVTREGNTLSINSTNISTYDVPQIEGKSIRAGLLFAGPLLARFGHAVIPLPGGCKLGHRGIGAHLDVFMKLGIEVVPSDNQVELIDPLFGKRSGPASVFMREASVTAVENLMIFAAGSGMSITIQGAATEPHVVDLATFLADTGVEINGIGSNIITLHGKKPNDLTDVSFKPRFDFVDFTGYVVAAAITDGEIRIKDANDPSIIAPIVDWLTLFGVDITPDGNDIIVKRTPDRGLWIDHHSTFPMAGKRLPKLYPRPWPGFPVDCIPMILPLAAKMTRGKILIMNWMYEDGLGLTRELRMMGADIFDASPIRVIVDGKDSFFDGKVEVTPPSVIQSVKACFLAALAGAPGSEFTIRNFHLLYRRYPDVIEKYKALGADIEPA